jgi:hypothetical protein
MEEKTICFGGLDFKFPRDITLTYGKENEREWYEYWKGKKGIVIQRASKTSYWYIFFLSGETIRTYKTPDIKGYQTINEAINELEQIGFNVKIKNELKKYVAIKYNYIDKKLNFHFFETAIEDETDLQYLMENHETEVIIVEFERFREAILDLISHNASLLPECIKFESVEYETDISKSNSI